MLLIQGKWQCSVMFSVQCSTVQYSAVCWSAVQWSALLCSTVQWQCKIVTGYFSFLISCHCVDRLFSLLAVQCKYCVFLSKKKTSAVQCSAVQCKYCAFPYQTTLHYSGFHYETDCHILVEIKTLFFPVLLCDTFYVLWRKIYGLALLVVNFPAKYQYCNLVLFDSF